MATSAHYQPDGRAWAQDRKFEPSLRYRDGIDLDLIEVSNDDKDWTYVACEDAHPCRHCDCIAPHIDSIFIAVDGACRGNGQVNAKAAIGVFFGQASTYNQSVLLTEPNMTNQIAELKAGILALKQAKEIVRNNALPYGPLHTIVIKSDSDYLVKGMTEWVFKWETNGYKTAKRKLVENAKLFQELCALVGDLNTSNVEVLFWRVPREMNKEADRLANEAFCGQ
ncbi:ribonuclease H-like domain-containing protein [Fusarium venenatum]|uniref:ribonuclease H-like domain-containing protein n=1 Tax=Fusarium venenatum TaxID=56646 RepID=UPI001E0E78A0|nr:ribonuclease H-like domain-containing protein [Fusarium venenatum]